MKVAFFTQILNSGIGEVRAKQPARWINKFTEHTAFCFDEKDLVYSDRWDLIKSFDVIVVHKSSGPLLEMVKLAKKGNKVVIYDTDDYDEEVFGQYFALSYMQDRISLLHDMLGYVDAITTASEPLSDRMKKWGRPIETLPNGYDLTLPEYRPDPTPYFISNEGRHFKIAWGGSSSHADDFAMFAKMGVIERLNEEYPIDWYFYGMMPKPLDRKVGKGGVYARLGESIAEYIQAFYSDADILIAPLIQNEFNGCRSVLKLLEAGVAQKPIVASRVESYERYAGGGVVLVDNDPDQWYSALHDLIIDQGKREFLGSNNHEDVYRHYTAGKITDKRVSFYESVLNGISG